MFVLILHLILMPANFRVSVCHLNKYLKITPYESSLIFLLIKVDYKVFCF